LHRAPISDIDEIMSILSCSSLAFVCSLAGIVAGPADLASFPTDPPSPRIYNGEDVGLCGWPTAVYMSMQGSSCTGVLVHPLIVMTAAHCISGVDTARIEFGESSLTGRVLANTEYCRPNPNYYGTGSGSDWGYCKLETPVLSVPIIPVVAGCEEGAIHTGARIMHVGFGVQEDGSGGIKQQLDTTIDSVSQGREIISGDGDSIICNGDSGGPTYVWMDPSDGGDGTWRVAAIHSWAQGADASDPNCYGQAGSVIVWQGVEWIEQDSGVDITPCHDGDTWNPTYHCQGFPQEPWNGSGTYTTECVNEPAIGLSEMCGPPLAADAEAPMVTITTPADGVELQTQGGTAPVHIEVEASDQGWGMESVELTIWNVDLNDGQTSPRTVWEPWVWDADLPPGGYEVTAVGYDLAGNTADDVIRFGVDQEAPEPEDTDSGTGTGGGDGGDDGGDGGTGSGDGGDDGSGDGGDDGGDDGDDGGTPPQDGGRDSDDSGCGCTTRTPGGDALAGLFGLALLVMPARRRRRR
jgi:MYXO-CTERM domain-containing protein